MFYGNINESVLQEGKILDFVKKIFKKKKKDVNVSGFISEDAQTSIFDERVYIEVEAKFRDKLAEYKEKVKNDARIINDHEKEAREKCAEYWNKIIKDLKEDDDKESENIKESDIEFENCAYYPAYNYYDIGVKLGHMPDVVYNADDIYVCCNIKVSGEGEVKFEIFDYD